MSPGRRVWLVQPGRKGQRVTRETRVRRTRTKPSFAPPKAAPVIRVLRTRSVPRLSQVRRSSRHSATFPPGDYVVSGQVTIVAAAGSDWRVSCGLRVPLSGPGWAGGATATVGDDLGDQSEVSLPILFGARVASDGTTMGLNCARSAGAGALGVGGNPLVTYADFIATKVGSLRQ